MILVTLKVEECHPGNVLRLYFYVTYTNLN